MDSSDGTVSGIYFVATLAILISDLCYRLFVLKCYWNSSHFVSDNPEGEPPEVKAHERLGEVLSVLKGVLNKYQPLHSTDILASAGTLISKVKSHNYEDTSKAPDEFYESIDQLALAFSSR